MQIKKVKKIAAFPNKCMKNGHTTRHDSDTGFWSSCDVSSSEDESISIDANDTSNTWNDGNVMRINGYECKNFKINGRYYNFKKDV